MTSTLFLEILAAAAGIGLSPFPIIATTLILSGQKARIRGLTFAFGWLIGLGLLTAIVFFFAASADSFSMKDHAIVEWIRIIAGVSLLLLAFKKWPRNKSGDQPSKTPSWLNTIDSLTPAKTSMLGLFMGGVNPKNLAFGLVVITTIIEMELGAPLQFFALLAFVLLSSIAILGLVLYALIGRESASRPLTKIKNFMIRKNDLIMVILYLIFGTLLTIKGVNHLI